jgi:acyl-CoA synthetase (NDP forming)
MNINNYSFSGKNRKMLTEVEAKNILREAGIPVVETKLARSKKEAISMSKEMGFPVVLKIVSPDIIHKSDVGGVKLDLKNYRQVSEAYSEMMSSIKENYPEARIEGASVQKMVQPGVEVIIGVATDAQFGPVLMFGLGGIFVEVLKDISFRIVPVSRRDVREMITEIKGYPMLKGYRGQEPANIPLLEELIIKVSDFVEKNPMVKELDLNPVFAYKESALAVDARVVVESSQEF